MEIVKEFGISGAKIRIVAALHPSSQPDDVLKLVTRGDTNHVMAAIDWFRKRRLKPEAFAQYLLIRIVNACITALKPNKRLITSPNMEVNIVINPPARLFDAPAESSFDALAQYDSHLSGPNYAFIRFFPDHAFFSNFMKSENILRQVMLHEMQHHGAMGYSNIVDTVTSRAHELQKSGRLSYNGWIAIAALLELKNEGVPKFSEWADAGAYFLNFSELEKFHMLFLTIPASTKAQLNSNYKLIKSSAYHAGLTMLCTILAQRILMKSIVAYIQLVGEKEFIPLKSLKFYYGVRDVYIFCPSTGKYADGTIDPVNHKLRAQNEAKRLLQEMQDKSHLYFLSTYEAACRYLGVKPIIDRQVYVKVKLACHLNFLRQIQASGASAAVA